MRREWSLLELVTLGLILGIIANGFYDVFKAWLRPLFDGKALTFEEVLKALVPALAAALTVLVVFLLLGAILLTKRKRARQKDVETIKKLA